MPQVCVAPSSTGSVSGVASHDLTLLKTETDPMFQSLLIPLYVHTSSNCLPMLRFHNIGVFHENFKTCTSFTSLLKKERVVLGLSASKQTNSLFYYQSRQTEHNSFLFFETCSALKGGKKFYVFESLPTETKWRPNKPKYLLRLRVSVSPTQRTHS